MDKSKNFTNLREFFKHLVTTLEESKVTTSAQIEVEMLFEAFYQKSFRELFFYLDKALLKKDEEELTSQLFRRINNNEPIQYITNKAYFRNLELYVAPGVLIPRPETEILVDWVLEKAKIYEDVKVLDIGTGSGAIALSIAQERPNFLVTGVDVSLDALAIANKNREDLKLTNVTLKESNLFSNLKGQKFNIIAANLPYVTFEEYEELPLDVKLHEPQLALTAACNGLELLYQTGDSLKDYLTNNGCAIFELSPHQAPIFAKYLEKLGFKSKILKDLTNRDRFVIGELI
jgi:release factor glutamine methyltransferase